MSEIIDVNWYDAGGTGILGQSIGIVLILNEHEGFKCYIGITPSDLRTPTEHARLIYEHGTKINHDHAQAVWGDRMKAEWENRHLSEDFRGYKYDGVFREVLK